MSLNPGIAVATAIFIIILFPHVLGRLLESYLLLHATLNQFEILATDRRDMPQTFVGSRFSINMQIRPPGRFKMAENLALLSTKIALSLKRPKGIGCSLVLILYG